MTCSQSQNSLFFLLNGAIPVLKHSTLNTFLLTGAKLVLSYLAEAILVSDIILITNSLAGAILLLSGLAGERILRLSFLMQFRAQQSGVSRTIAQTNKTFQHCWRELNSCSAI